MKKFLLIAGLIACLSCPAQTQQGYKNPVIPGFHPDPSICRVGEECRSDERRVGRFLFGNQQFSVFSRSAGIS